MILIPLRAASEHIVRTMRALLSTRLITSATRRNTAVSRSLQTSSLKAAIAHPITAHGPPPKPPAPAPEFQERTASQGEDAEAPKEQGKGNEAESPAPSKTSDALKKRFWKYVDVAKKPGVFVSTVAGRRVYMRANGEKREVTMYY